MASPSPLLDPEQTVRCWVERIVVGQGFCPYARQPVAEDRVRYVTLGDRSIPEILEALLHEAQVLDTTPETETTLLILDQGPENFAEYLDLADLAETWLVDQGYEGVYQLATFHPQYQFADLDPEDAGNWTNRSPYPILHLIREATITRLVPEDADPEAIPARNRAYARHMGVEALRSLLAGCM